MKFTRRNLLRAGVLGAGASAFAFVPLSVSPAQAAACGTTSWNLIAGQHNDVGTITVENDTTNLYVTFSLDDPDFPDAVFGNLHVWVGSSLLTLPVAGNGQPIPGQFPFQYDATGKKTYTFTIPLGTVSLPDLTTLCPVGQDPVKLYVVAHAEVFLDGDTTAEEHETAFGGDEPGPGPRWWLYAQYTVCCTPSTDTNYVCQTAFAKGNKITVVADHHVFTTDPKANPEVLPSLALTKNRWGWAIKVKKGVPADYPIWAGAALNNTKKGRLVGNLHVEWDGSNVSVAYQLSGANLLEEVHVYASDTPPTTIAPGQYGYTEFFNPKVKNHSANIGVTDDNNDGEMWLIAHAVVCRLVT
jgi:hypothetical protein